MELIAIALMIMMEICHSQLPFLHNANLTMPSLFAMRLTGGCDAIPALVQY